MKKQASKEMFCAVSLSQWLICGAVWIKGKLSAGLRTADEREQAPCNRSSVLAPVAMNFAGNDCQCGAAWQ
jgi:hypothetical protein